MNPAPYRATVSELEISAEDPSLMRWLRQRHPEVSGNALKRLIETGKLSVDGKRVSSGSQKLLPGQEVVFQPNAPRADKEHSAGPRIYYVDGAVAVAEKPTGILTLPFGEERDALMSRVQKVIPKLEKAGPIHPLRAVHRLDKEASGLVVFTRHVRAQRNLQEQFAEHTVERAYLALVHGRVNFVGRQKVESVLVSDRGDGLKGTRRDPDQQGKNAVTWLEVMEVFPNATLLRCELETGRTHQIRIHCAELGHPLIGEPVYIRDYRGKLFKAPRMMLHATALGFDHPVTGQRLRYDSPMPPELVGFIRTLKRGAAVPDQVAPTAPLPMEDADDGEIE